MQSICFAIAIATDKQLPALLSTESNGFLANAIISGITMRLHISELLKSWRDSLCESRTSLLRKLDTTGLRLKTFLVAPKKPTSNEIWLTQTPLDVGSTIDLNKYRSK